MDEKDTRIIEALKENSNQSTRQISRKTGIPITTVHKRIKKLKERKIIKRFTIELDHEKTGKAMAVYILITVDLKRLKEKNKTQYEISRELKKIPCVERIDIVIGGTDMIASLRVRDTRELYEVLFGKIQLIDGIINTQTMTVMH